MGIWYYTYLFPGPSKPLQPENILQVLSSYEFNIDSEIYLAEEIDEQGHLEFINPVQVKGEIETGIYNRLTTKEQLLFECSDKHMILTNCFAPRYFNPFICLGCLARGYDQLSRQLKEYYLQLLGEIGNACSAEYIIILLEGASFFEDRFLEIDGQRCLSLIERENEQWGDVLIDFWQKENSLISLPEGLDAQVCLETPYGYISYKPNECA